MEKTCFKCGEEKDAAEFYDHSEMGDGRLGKCKECTKVDVRANRAANIDYYRAYDRERAKLPHRRESCDAQSRKWRTADKRRMKCHNAVARAVKAGTLKKKPCERCGNQKSLAHHEDYDKPLDVMWLCQPCHKVRHAEIDAEKKVLCDPFYVSP